MPFFALAIMKFSAITIILLSTVSKSFCHEGYYSSCDLDSKWQKIPFPGAVIRSWLQSITPIPSETKTHFANFESQEEHLVPRKAKFVTNGKLSWTRFGENYYDGWVYGHVELKRGKVEGKNLAYIYPDLETVLLGDFEKGKLLKGLASRIKGYR